MKYQMLVLDLDGTLTNSKKEITEPTRKALLEIQKRERSSYLPVDDRSTALPRLPIFWKWKNTADTCFLSTVPASPDVPPARSSTTAPCRQV